MGLPDWLLRPDPDSVLAVSDGPHAPATVMQQLAAVGALPSWQVFSGWMIGSPPVWLSDLRRGSGFSVMGSGGARAAVEDGRLRYLPIRLSQVPKLLQSTIRPDVTVVRARPVGRGFVLAPSAGWAVTACQVARRVVIEVDSNLPRVDAPAVPGNIELVVEAEELSVRPPPVAIDDVDRRIGHLVASMVPEGATIQHGPGSIAEAVVGALERPVRVFSGMLSDSLLRLAERGLLTGTPAVGAYLCGGAELDTFAASGTVRITGVEETHDLGRVSAIPNFVALNTALQVGHDGAINVEGVGGRSIAGVGGHPDYALAASLSPGGLSVVAVRSTTSSGKPTIVPQVERVSTAPSDIDVVVTENGIADLRGKTTPERRAALLAISATA